METEVQTAFTVTPTVQNVQDAMAAINGRIREDQGNTSTGFMSFLAGHAPPDFLMNTPLGVLGAPDNQTVSLEVQSQDLDEANGAGDLPLVSRNVIQKLDELVKILQEQDEKQQMETAVKQLDKAMESLIVRLTTGDDDKVQRTNSVKAMQDSVNAFLSKTAKEPFEPLGPILPEKTILAQITDMLQIISTVVKTHYAQKVPRAEGSTQAGSKSKPENVPSVSWTSSVSSTNDRPLHRTFKLIDVQLGIGKPLSKTNVF